MNVFKEMALSIYSYKSYKEFLNNKKSKVFGFGLLLMLFYWLLTIVVPLAQLGVIGSGLSQKIDEVVPEFELADGVLWVEDVFEYEEANVYVNIDTEPGSYFYDAYEMRDSLNAYDSVLLIDSEKIIMKNGGQLEQYYFEDLDGAEYTKADLMGLVPTLYVFVVIFLIIAYLWMTALFFLGVVLVALCGMIVASCMKCQLTFGQLYLLGVYSRVLPLIIKAGVSFLPINIPFFWVINFGISLLIIGAAIQKIKEQNLQKPLEFSSGNNEFGNGYPNGYNGGYNGNNYNGNIYNNGYNQNGYRSGNYGNGSNGNGGNFTGNFSGGNSYTGNYNDNGNYSAGNYNTGNYNNGSYPTGNDSAGNRDNGER